MTAEPETATLPKEQLASVPTVAQPQKETKISFNLPDIVDVSEDNSAAPPPSLDDLVTNNTPPKSSAKPGSKIAALQANMNFNMNAFVPGVVRPRKPSAPSDTTIVTAPPASATTDDGRLTTVTKSRARPANRRRPTQKRNLETPMEQGIFDDDLAISPEKDVDGFHPSNIGKMVLGLPCYLPATPFGIVKLLEQYNIETSGKHAVVIGRSNIVGSPMSILLARNEKVGNCTVTLTHSRTKNLKEISLQADIIIAAIGKPEFVTADMVKEGAIVIDVGTTRVPDASKKSGFTLKGDVKFDEVAPKCSFITPVPGGVGPMTVTALLFNTLQASKQKDSLTVTN
jgi:hypothetical protein